MENTHVLIDADGQAVLSGSEGEMLAALHDLEDEGITGCHITLNDQLLSHPWHWECLDWGD